jgi:hypothetical protein
VTWPACAGPAVPGYRRAAATAGLERPSPVFDPEDPGMRRWLCQALREAGRPQGLTSYLDRDTLIAVAGAVPARRRAAGLARAPLAAARCVAWDGLMPVSGLHRQIAALAWAAVGSTGSR